MPLGMCFIHVDLFKIVRFVLPQLPTGDTAKTFSPDSSSRFLRDKPKKLQLFTTNAGSQPDVLVHNAHVRAKDHKR